MKFKRGIIHIAVILAALVGLTIAATIALFAGHPPETRLISDLERICLKNPADRRCQSPQPTLSPAAKVTPSPSTSRSPSPSLNPTQPPFSSPSPTPTPSPSPTPSPEVYIPEQGGYNFDNQTDDYYSYSSDNYPYDQSYPSYSPSNELSYQQPLPSPTETPASSSPEPSPESLTSPQTSPSPTLASQPPTPQPATCPPDFNGDGKVTLADIWDLIGHYRNPQIKYDLNFDGRVNLIDLFIELGNRGKTC